LSGRGRDSSNSSFEGSYAILKHIDSGISNAGVDVSRRSQSKEIGAMSRIIKDEAGGCIDWDSMSIGGRIWNLTSVKLECLEFGFFVELVRHGVE